MLESGLNLYSKETLVCFVIARPLLFLLKDFKKC